MKGSDWPRISMRTRRIDAKVNLAWHDLDLIVAGREAVPPRPGIIATPGRRAFGGPG